MIARSQMRRQLYNKGTMPARNKKNFRSTKSGAGMTAAGVRAYRRMNPGSKLKTAVGELWLIGEATRGGRGGGCA